MSNIHAVCNCLIQYVCAHYTITFFLLSDFMVTNDVQEHTIGITELEVELDPITIVDDSFPEDNETFFLYLMKGDGGEFQNIFPEREPARMTIIDKNG